MAGFNEKYKLVDGAVREAIDTYNEALSAVSFLQDTITDTKEELKELEENLSDLEDERDQELNMAEEVRFPTRAGSAYVAYEDSDGAIICAFCASTLHEQVEPNEIGTLELAGWHVMEPDEAQETACGTCGEPIDYANDLYERS